MTNPIIRVHNLETGEIADREMNAEELTQYEADQAADATRQEAEAAKAAEKEAAKQAVLDRLGLTAEEAALLLGGN